MDCRNTNSNIKLEAPVMLLCSTCRPSVWLLQLHRLYRPSHQMAIHHSMRRIFRQCPITFPHSTVTDRCWHHAMHLKTSVSQTSSCQAANAMPCYNLMSTNILIPGESSRTVHHRPASSSRLSRSRSAGNTGNTY